MSRARSRKRPSAWAAMLAQPRTFPPPWLHSYAGAWPVVRIIPLLRRAPSAAHTIEAFVMSRTITVTWGDPPVAQGQAALASLAVIAAVTPHGGEQTISTIATVQPGAQSYTLDPPLAGATYLFAVQATDVNGLPGPQSAWSNQVGPTGVPGAPTNVTATVNG